VRVSARRDGEAVIVEAQARLRAPLPLIWEVLTDYERYVEFVPDLQVSRVLSREHDKALVEQRGTAGFFLFRFPLEVQLVVTEVPFERVTCQSVAGNFKELTGVYELSAEADAMRLVYRGRLVPAFRLPPLVGLPALRASVERQFGALVREVERRGAASSGSEAR
jgi:ribosome-associated toxin RatA of RatAB toxin-antitoxin module